MSNKITDLLHFFAQASATYNTNEVLPTIHGTMPNYPRYGRKKHAVKNHHEDYAVTKKAESDYLNPVSWYDHSETTSINPANNQGRFEPLDRPTQFPSFFTTFADITENADLPDYVGSRYKKSKKLSVDEQKNYAVNKKYKSFKRKQRPVKDFNEISISENEKNVPSYFQPAHFSAKMLPPFRKNYHFSNTATREINTSEHEKKNVINPKKEEENQHPYGSDYLKISDWQIKTDNSRKDLQYHHKKDAFR